MCRIDYIRKLCTVAAMVYGFPILLGALAVLSFRGSFIYQKKLHDTEHIKLWCVVVEKSEYIEYDSNDQKSGENSRATKYRMLVKPLKPDPNHKMYSAIQVDDVAWKSYVTKNVGDVVGFTLDKSDVFPDHERSMVGIPLVCCIAAGVVLFFVTIILFVFMFCFSWRTAKEFIRRGEGAWHTYWGN